jgi:hypothetical protein
LVNVRRKFLQESNKVYINVCMYVCMCMYVCKYAYVCMYVYKYAYVCMYVYKYAYVCMDVRKSACAGMRGTYLRDYVYIIHPVVLLHINQKTAVEHKLH